MFIHGNGQSQNEKRTAIYRSVMGWPFFVSTTKVIEYQINQKTLTLVLVNQQIRCDLFIYFSAEAANYETKDTPPYDDSHGTFVSGTTRGSTTGLTS